jgi:hypothetical protein
MHEPVRQYVLMHLPDHYDSVIEVGSLDINGGVRHLLDQKASYLGIDMQEGAGVDLVADFTTYTHPDPVDVVLCLEVLEHTETWREIIASIARNLSSFGTLIVTCATTGRPPHSARNGGQIQGGEFYQNVTRDELDTELAKHFSQFKSEVQGVDLRAWATE